MHGCGQGEHAGHVQTDEQSPTGVLRAEHEVILGVVGAVLRALETGRVGDAGFWGDAVTFFREFADRCHHAKEEAVLFPRLEARGVPRHGGPIGVMLAEHEEGRALLRAMDAAVAPAAAGDPVARGALAQAAREYCGLLTQHIAKENGVLFPMGERLLSGDDRRQMLAGFAAREHEDLGAGAHERLLAVAERLEGAVAD
jgi:hemerythrin-like domain-containing protein